MCQPDLLDHSVGADPALSLRDTLIEQSEFDVVDDRAVADEMEGLEHEADASCAYG